MEMQRERLQALFEKNGLRNTSQRQTIYEYLIQTDCHPTAKQIYDHLKPGHPSLSLATVYNTLDLLVGAGLITALGEIGDNQVHYDGNTRFDRNCHRKVRFRYPRFTYHVLRDLSRLSTQTNTNIKGDLI